MTFRYWVNYYSLIFLFAGTVYLICLHLVTGKIYVGFGEHMVYGRTWANKKEDTLFFWFVILFETLLAIFWFILIASSPEQFFNVFKSTD